MSDRLDRGRARPAPITINRRDIHFGIAEASDPNWYEGDPLRTAFCDALSLFFPEGERFFIRSVRHYAKRITDPVLRRDVADFIAQEAYHTREHQEYNRALAAQGLDVEMMEARVAEAMARVKAPLTSLALTAAIEHLTATFAHFALGDPSVFGKVAKPYRDLWMWHSVEEMEHKAVAFDVFKAVTADMPGWKVYLLRTIPLAVVTVNLHRILFANAIHILHQRGHSTGVVNWSKALWRMFVQPGFYRRTIGYYLTYYLPGFHPWRSDDSARAAEWRALFDAQAAREAQRHA